MLYLDEWAEIPTETLQTLVESLSGRVEAVIAPKRDQPEMLFFALFRLVWIVFELYVKV